jgi:signal transduction histidine kinase
LPHFALRVLIEIRPGNEVGVLVENAGEPISKQALPRIFDRFYRVDASRSDSGHHHGVWVSPSLLRSPACTGVTPRRPHPAD